MRSLLNKYFLIYIFSIAIVSCGRSQRAAIQLTGNAQSDILLMLKEGKHTADIMDGVKQTPQQAAISQKLEKAFQENYAWFAEYVKSVPEGDPLPYNERMGISKEEYDLFLKGNAEIISSGKETLEIEQHDQMISFKGTGRLVVFDSVKIDLLNKVATFRSYKLSTMDTVSVTDANNGLKSKWRGYGFSFDESNNFIPKTLEETAGYDHTSFKLTIGLIEKNNKIMLDFAGSKVIAGKKLIEIRVPAVFD